MTTKRASEKSATISFIRAIAMAMIISCHILQNQGIFLAFWLNLGVQIFFFMSGFLYGGKPDDYIGNKRKWYTKQFGKILLPYIMLTAIMCLIDVIFFDKSYTIKQIIISLTATQGIFGGGIPQLSHTWFITYILLCYIITPLLFYINARGATQKRFLLGIAITALIFCALDYFRLTSINMAWIFNYILGFYFAHYFVSRNKKYHLFQNLLVIIAVIAVAAKIIIRQGTISLSADNLLLIESWTHVIIGSALFMILYAIFNKIHVQYNTLINFSDKYSYYIYLTHQVFILGVFSIINALPNKLAGIFFAIITSVITGIILLHLSTLFKKKIIDKLTQLINTKSLIS